jgi:hypothetical protein
MKKTLVLIIAAGLLVGIVGAGYAAFFTDMGTAEANAFTAGNIDLVFDGTDDNVSAVWSPPSDWAPGDSIEAILRMTNRGSIDANHIYVGCINDTLSDPDGDSDLREAIKVEIWEDPGTGSFGSEQSAGLPGGTSDGYLSLKEFCDYQGDQIGFYAGSGSNPFGLDANEGNYYKWRMKLTFVDQGSNAWNWGSPDDIYQNDSCSFELRFQASQNSPTDGIYPITSIE